MILPTLLKNEKVHKHKQTTWFWLDKTLKYIIIVFRCTTSTRGV